MSFLHALKWSFFSELATKAIQPLVFIVLARLLTPEDFGVMTAAMMVIAFSQIFWEAGMGMALIQRQTDVEDAANVAFWVNLTLGVVISLLLFFAAHPIAENFLSDVRVGSVLQIMALQIMLGALSSVHVALLQKGMQFKRLFWVRIATVGISGMVSIPMAIHDMGFWALVAGSLTGQAFQLVILWWASDWRPRFAIEWNVAKDILRFGGWVGLSGFFAWFYAWADSLVVGYYLGSQDLGLYRVGSHVVVMLFSMVFQPFSPVFYSLLVQKSDGAEFKNLAVSGINIAIVFSVVMGISLFFLSGLFSGLLFPEAWRGIDSVIGMMALANGLAWTVCLNGDIYRAAKTPDRETLILGVTLLFYLPIYLFSIRFGLDAFLLSRVLATMLGAAFQFYFLHLYVGINFVPPVFKLFKYSSIVFICFTPVWLQGISQSTFDNPWLLSTVFMGALCAVYFAGGRAVFIDAEIIFRKPSVQKERCDEFRIR